MTEQDKRIPGMTRAKLAWGTATWGLGSAERGENTKGQASSMQEIVPQILTWLTTGA